MAVILVFPSSTQAEGRQGGSHLSLEGPRDARHAEDVTRSAQGWRPQPGKGAPVSAQPGRAPSAHSAGRRGSSRTQKERPPHSPVYALSGWSRTAASSRGEKAAGALQTKNNSPRGARQRRCAQEDCRGGGRSKGPGHLGGGSHTYKSTSVPVTATPGRVPGFHSRNAARSDVVWKLTWLLFPLLFHILIKVFSPIGNARRLAGFSKGPSCLPPRRGPGSLLQRSRAKPLPSLPGDPGRPHRYHAGGDTPQHSFSEFIHHFLPRPHPAPPRPAAPQRGPCSEI